MPETMQQPPAATAPARPATSADAENAQLDARLDLAAKKVALQSLEAQAGGPAAPAAPLPPGAVRGRIIYEADGKTIVLENPTAEQLQQIGVGIGTTAPPLPVNSKQIVALSIFSLGALVTIVWMVLHYFRGGRSAVAPRESTEMQARMARIENAIESVAVEVERMSEQQRYAAKVLSEGQAPGMRVNAPEPRTAVMTNRGGA